MVDAEVPVLSGFLNVPTQSGFSLNRISKKKSGQRRYCLLFKSSRHGIERLEISETKDDKNRKIITLENCVKITTEPAPANLIQIVKRTGTLTLNALNEDDLKEWLVALQTVAFRDKGGTLSRNTVIEEDNDLYCSSYGDGLFIITLIPSETSRRCNIEAKPYMLHLTATELQLKSAEDLSIIKAVWPYRFIRKYGYRDGKFTFEAGRKCDTGEGVFILDHTNPQEVFRCMSSKMKSMKKLISGESLNSLDCGENQLSAAMSMEAGSRSPLPPSPLNQNSCEFETNSTQSSISTRGFLSSTDSLNSVSANSNTPFKPLIKSIPSKPPRKLPSQNENASTNPNESKSSQQLQQQACDKFKKFQNYEPVSITTSTDPNKNGGSTVILTSSSTELIKQSSDVCPISNNNNNSNTNTNTNNNNNNNNNNNSNSNSNTNTNTNNNFNSNTNTNTNYNNNSNNNIKNHKPPDLPVRNESTIKQSERDYEIIETITEAWKTRGINEIKHTERITTSNDDLIDFVQQRTQSKRELINSVPRQADLSLKMINIDDNGIAENYDRLDFLSPNNHKTTSSGYKTILTVSSANNSKKTGPSIPNDYELIASPDMQPCRLADDSYLGYGVLRKPSVPGPQVPTNTNKNVSNVSQTMVNEAESTQPLDHRSYNGLSYAIVSKPKRV